jgi:shikimate kinase
MGGVERSILLTGMMGSGKSTGAIVNTENRELLRAKGELVLLEDLRVPTDGRTVEEVCAAVVRGLGRGEAV